MEIKEYCLAVVRRKNEVLLGLKNPERFGGGFWNFPGGKLEGLPAQRRVALEVQEETGLEVVSCRRLGMLNFEFVEGPVLRRVYLFEVDRTRGELRTPKPTDEIVELRWTPIAQMPYDAMFPADRVWVPLYLRGEPFPQRFLYDDTRSFTLLEPKSS